MDIRVNHSGAHPASSAAGFALAGLLAMFMAPTLLCPPAAGADASATARFRKEVQPILQEYCYDCHGDGAKKGGVAFDELKSDQAILNPDLWLNALRYLRAGLMPPQS